MAYASIVDVKVICERHTCVSTVQTVKSYVVFAPIVDFKQTKQPHNLHICIQHQPVIQCIITYWLAFLEHMLMQTSPFTNLSYSYTRFTSEIQQSV